MTGKRPKIVFLDAGSVDYGDISFTPIARLGRFAACHRTPARLTAARCRGAEVVIANKVVFDAATLGRTRPGLICVAATGYNNIDVRAAKKFGVGVCNVPAYSTDDVAEHALMLMLATARRLPEHARAVRSLRWSRSPQFCLTDYPFAPLAGRRLGIVGYGATGRRVARLARVFGMEVVIAALPGRRYPRSPARVPFRRVLQICDIVSLHCLLSESTRGLIGPTALSLMKPEALLVNTARGPLVDEKAVAHALRRGHLAGYAADVLGAEPPQSDHPLFARDLAGKVLLTPHIAWAGRDSRRRLIEEMALNIRAFLDGKRRNRVV